MTSLIDAIGNTPLIPLRRVERAGAPVWVKCEFLNPGGSVKDRIARSIIEDARERGVLEPGQTIVEATAGNTGVGLCLVAAHYGYRVVCVMPEKMSSDKRAALRRLGAEVIVTPNAPLDSPDNFRQVAERLADERGWLLADQFRNPANIAAHPQGTGPELLRQTDGRLAAFVAGCGTGGTLTGVGRHFREAGCSAPLVLADPEGSALAHWIATGELGESGSYSVEGIGSSVPSPNLDRSVIRWAEVISDEESFATARLLMAREGLMVGGSAGTAVAAAMRVAARIGGDDPVVAILPDGADRYASKPWMQVVNAN